MLLWKFCITKYTLSDVITKVPLQNVIGPMNKTCPNLKERAATTAPQQSRGNSWTPGGAVRERVNRCKKEQQKFQLDARNAFFQVRVAQAEEQAFQKG